MGEKMARVGVARVRGRVCVSRALRERRVVEDDDLVNGEDGEGTCDAAGDGQALVCGREAIKWLRAALEASRGKAVMYLVMTLAGMATDTVQWRPP